MAEAKKQFVNELEAERLAREHIQNYMNACNCQTVDDAKRASQKLVAVAFDCMDKIHNGKAQRLPTH